MKIKLIMDTSKNSIRLCSRSPLQKKRLFLFSIVLFSSSLFSQNFDFKTTKTINEIKTYSFSRTISTTDEILSIAVPVCLTGYGLIARDENTLYKGISTALAISASAVIMYSAKNLIKRERPFVAYPNDFFNHANKNAKGYSFPSGHTSLGFALATSLTLSYPKWYIITPSYLLAASVAYSRMNLGVHYFSDICTGAVIGAGCAYLAYLSTKYMQKKYGKTDSVTLGIMPASNCLSFVILF
jgi:membrane-associated phospholipid phosphatase